jgi:hypothetical protein
MALVFLSSALDGIEMEKIKRRYTCAERELCALGHKLVNTFVYYKRSWARAKGNGSIRDVKEIVDSDLVTLRDADVLVVDISLPRHNYVGCICEMVYAKVWGISVVAYPKRNTLVKRPFFKYHCTIICGTRSEAFNAIESIVSNEE